jgi:membrane protein YqaA with SNARE-associated domain
MWWHYLLVFLGAFLFDVFPFPLPPAFIIMLFFQIIYDLNFWLVILFGVIGSIIGRYILMLYIPQIADRIFKPSKNEDIQFLGKVLKEKGWKSQIIIIAYSLLPLPTTPLFIAAGIGKVKPLYIIPAFFIGKFTSDAFYVFFGKYETEQFEEIISGITSFQSFLSLSFGFFLIFAILFIDWRSLIQFKKLKINFNIWKT